VRQEREGGGVKIIRPGVFVFTPTGSLITGWHVDVDGCSYSSRQAMERDFLKVVLLHAARVGGIELNCEAPAPSDAMTLDAERAALDAIAVARWTPQ
jgi:hypothetical protein